MFESFIFPAGEVHLKQRSEIEPILYFPQETALSDHIMKIMLAADIAKRNQKDVSLFLPYLPYARQDRPTSLEEPFSLKVFGDILNTASFKNVYTLDVHSDVAFACINNLINIPVEILLPYLIKNKNRTLVIPDQGAYKKLSKITSYFNDYAITIKHRDISNGHITLKHLIGNVDGKDCLIVDDICDGGGTFVLLADELRKLGASSVELYVTHGIFTKGVETLIEHGIDHIYTFNSVRQDLNEDTFVNYLTIFDVKGIMNEYFTLN